MFIFNPIRYVFLSCFRFTFSIAPLVVAGLIGAGASIFNAVSQSISNKKNRDFQNDVNEQNQANWREEFEYNKYLNENQFQISSKDMRSAGINPIVGAGGNMNSFSASAGLSASQDVAPQIDSSALASLYSSVLGKDTSDKQLSFDKQVHEDEMQLEEEKLEFERAKLEQEKVRDANTHVDSRYATDMQMKLADAQRLWEDSGSHREAVKALNQDLEEMKRDTAFEATKVPRMRVTWNDATKSYVTQPMHDFEGNIIYMSGSEFAQEMQYRIIELQRRGVDFDTAEWARVWSLISSTASAAGAFVK